MHLNNLATRNTTHSGFSQSSDWWLQEKQQTLLLLFQQVSQRVPAYADFLKKHKIDPSKVKHYNDLSVVPPVSKDNYLRQYPMPMLCWDGHINRGLMLCSTSGSTGAPYYFPRTQQLDRQGSYLLEQFLNQSHCKGPVLTIVCFGMGVWIGGVLIYSALQMLQQRDERAISIIAPGINKPEILSALKNLAPQYEEVVLLGYPPFIKDVFDTAINENIDVRSLNIKLMFAAEAITETFRQYLCDHIGISNPFTDIHNIYGSADIGAMAIEGAAGILLKKLASENPQVASDFFLASKNPTAAQYNPHFTNFDCEDSNILVSGDSALPLIRYSLGDRGGVFSFAQAKEMLAASGIDFEREAKERGAGPLPELPFVYVHERVDFSVKFYGAIIFPEHIREPVQDSRFKQYLTGRFCMEIDEDGHGDQRLVVSIELKNGQESTPTLVKELIEHIRPSLAHHSSEYANNLQALGKKVDPTVRLLPYEDERYFQQGIKQKWARTTDSAPS
ncbi:phenylacetate--CoA ligase family protein [Aurantivibrio plasticivorans]